MESESFHDMEELSNHMGLFLQKTNIIRDYLVGGWLQGLLLLAMLAHALVPLLCAAHVQGCDGAVITLRVKMI